MLLMYNRADLLSPFGMYPQRCAMSQRVMKPGFGHFATVKYPQEVEPRVFLRRQRKSFNILIDLRGGFEKSSIQVRILGQRLRVTANRREELPISWLASQFFLDEPTNRDKFWKRIFELPDNVDPNAISARFNRNGLLSIHCPYFNQAGQHKKPRRITIEDGQEEIDGVNVEEAPDMQQPPVQHYERQAGDGSPTETAIDDHTLETDECCMSEEEREIAEPTLNNAEKSWQEDEVVHEGTKRKTNEDAEVDNASAMEDEDGKIEACAY